MMVLDYYSARDQFINEDHSFHSEEDIRFASKLNLNLVDRTQKHHRRLWNNGQLALIALFVVSNVQVGGEPEDALIVLPAIDSLASLSLQHWLFCFWMMFLLYQLCTIAQVLSALYTTNLARSIQHYYLSYRGRSNYSRSNYHEFFDYDIQR